MIMDYFSKDLSVVIDKKSISYNLNDVVIIFSSVVNAVKYLHDSKVMHRVSHIKSF
jgi:serine/threonine protein kinase